MGLYFDPGTCTDNVVVSIDMVRVRYRIDDLKHWEDKLIRLDRKYQSDVWSNTYPVLVPSPGRYKYFSSVPAGKSTCNCFAGLYDSDCVLTPVVDLEYNPNKCLGFPGNLSAYLFDLLKWLWGCSKETDIRRFDLAVDFYGVDRGCVYSNVSDARMPRSVGRGATITRSFGPHQKNGFLKVYNKKEESNLDEECTRIEVTLSGDNSSNLKEILRCFGNHWAFYDDSVGKTLTEKMLLALLHSDPDALFSLLGTAERHLRKKYENLIAAGSRTLSLPVIVSDDVPLCDWIQASLRRCIEPFIV